MAKKVVVGMSGGVDSSTAALLLKRAGYEVIGATVKTWEEGEDFDAENDTHDVALAREIADVIGIPFRTKNLRREFKERVVDNFTSEYLAGRTPNPCIVCNRFVKWAGLLAIAEELGADYVATGHYAKIDRLPNGRFAIKNSASATKDQTYVLYRLTQEQLRHTLFPVGDYEKSEIREIARAAGLPSADTPDSQEICFFHGTDYAGFLTRNCDGPAVRPGNFVTRDGKILGQHQGIVHYTIGQRKGLNLSLGHPVFVMEIRPETNEVVIGEEEEIFTREVEVQDLCFMAVPDVTEGRFTAKIRYAHKAAPCVIRRTDKDRLQCVFEEPQRAPTAGQALVFYEGEYVAGGGVIV